MPLPNVSRRHFIQAAVGASAILTAGSVVTPARADELLPTESNIEGPYYRAGAPFRNELYEEGEPGTPLLVWGNVFDTSCKPLANALIDIWQTDDSGAYDNTSAEYRGRGRHLTGDDGLWWLWTIWPGYYPGRPYHLHLKASQKGYRFLTTQLYFRDDPRTKRDPWYRPSLELDWFESENGSGIYYAYYNVVLAAK